MRLKAWCVGVRMLEKIAPGKMWESVGFHISIFTPQNTRTHHNPEPVSSPVVLLLASRLGAGGGRPRP